MTLFFKCIVWGALNEVASRKQKTATWKALQEEGEIYITLQLWSCDSQSIQGIKAPQQPTSSFLVLFSYFNVEEVCFFLILEQLLWCVLLEHVGSTCPCFTGLLQYSHEKGEKGGSLSFKFNLVDPEGNKLIDQSFFISVLGRVPPTPTHTSCYLLHSH